MAEEWVVIVQRERQDVYGALRQLLQGTALRVVLDRRQGERRRTDGAGSRWAGSTPRPPWRRASRWLTPPRR
jgi:hypothetical protein